MAKELKRIFVYAFLLMVGMLTTTDAYAFKDFSVIVNNQDGTLLTADEQVQGTSVSFGVAVAEDGTVSRVAADDASAVAVISGKYHSDHGMTNLECIVAVEGGVKVTFGNCTYSSRQATITDADGNVVSATITQNCWKNDRSNVTEAYYAGGATTLTIKASDYCPFLAVEASEYVPEKHTINFSMTDDTVVGTAPATVNWTKVTNSHCHSIASSSRRVTPSPHGTTELPTLLQALNTLQKLTSLSLLSSRQTQWLWLTAPRQ